MFFAITTPAPEAGIIVSVFLVMTVIITVVCGIEAVIRVVIIDALIPKVWFITGVVPRIVVALTLVYGIYLMCQCYCCW